MPGDAGVAYVSELGSLKEFEALSAAEVIAGVEYLAPIEGRPTPQPLTAECHLQSMHRYPWHLPFLQSFPGLAGASFERYLRWVLRMATQGLWAARCSIGPRRNTRSHSVQAIPCSTRSYRR